MSRLRRWSACGLVVVVMILLRHMVLAQDAKKDAAAPAPAATEKKAEEKKPDAAKPEEKKPDAAKPEDKKPDEKAATPPAWAPPPYFSGTNDDPKNPKWPDQTGGNAGTWITPSADTKGGGDDVSTLKTPDVYDRVAHNAFSINMVWALVTGFLVMFMQAGFAMVETGFCRSKNAAHTITMNFMIYGLGCLGFWVYGFAIGWGNLSHGPSGPAAYSALGPGTSVLDSGIGIEEQKDDKGALTGAYKWGIIGTRGFCLVSTEDVSVLGLFFFMMVFMDTTATIPTGAMAERWAWKNFCIYGLWVALPYCIYANWLWGGGWLAQMGVNWKLGHGAVDFAGSGVVHGMGGILALAGAIVLGPRIGKYIDGKPVAIPGHHIPMAVVGTFILAFGWFGFNPGSTLSGTDLRISFIVVNTMLASIGGALAAMAYLMFIRGKKPDPSMLCNGMLAGLVAITAPSSFVSPWAAFVIGVIAGVIVVESVYFFDRIGVDDPVGAISVHGINGLWGVLSVGIFSSGKYGAGWNGVERYAALTTDAAKADWTSKMGVAYDGVRGILYGDASQLYAQIIDCAVLAVFGFVMGYVWFKFSNLITPIRVSKETELAGLDVPEMGAEGYPDFAKLH